MYFIPITTKYCFSIHTVWTLIWELNLHGRQSCKHFCKRIFLTNTEHSSGQQQRMCKADHAFTQPVSTVNVFHTILTTTISDFSEHKIFWNNNKLLNSLNLKMIFYVLSLNFFSKEFNMIMIWPLGINNSCFVYSLRAWDQKKKLA